MEQKSYPYGPPIWRTIFCKIKGKNWCHSSGKTPPGRKYDTAVSSYIDNDKSMRAREERYELGTLDNLLIDTL